MDIVWSPLPINTPLSYFAGSSEKSPVVEIDFGVRWLSPNVQPLNKDSTTFGSMCDIELPMFFIASIVGPFTKEDKAAYTASLYLSLSKEISKFNNSGIFINVPKLFNNPSLNAPTLYDTKYSSPSVNVVDSLKSITLSPYS